MSSLSDTPPEASSRLSLTIVLLLVTCLLVLAFLFQGSRGIWQPDEGYYAGTAVTMLSKETLLFLVIKHDHLTEAIDLLRANGIESRTVPLPHDRALLFPGSDRPNILPEDKGSKKEKETDA